MNENEIRSCHFSADMPVKRQYSFLTVQVFLSKSVSVALFKKQTGFSWNAKDH